MDVTNKYKKLSNFSFFDNSQASLQNPFINNNIINNNYNPNLPSNAYIYPNHQYDACQDSNINENNTNTQNFQSEALNSNNNPSYEYNNLVELEKANINDKNNLACENKTGSIYTTNSLVNSPTRNLRNTNNKAGHGNYSIINMF